MRFLFALLLAACSGPGQKLGTSQQMLGTCIEPEDHGAVADDGLDDRVALQAAIDAAEAGPGCLTLGSGTYHATRKQVIGTSNIPSLIVNGPLVIRGAGRDESTIAMLGPSYAPSGTPGNWWLLAVQDAEDVDLSDFSLDGAERTATGEQTHLLHFKGPVDDAKVERMAFNMPDIGGGSTGGDCIRMLGEATALVTDITLRDLYAPECDRSFVSLQRGLRDILIERAESVLVGDQSIDFEPTNGEAFSCSPVIQDVMVRDSTLARGTAAQGDTTIAIAGSGCSTTSRVTLMDTDVLDGGAQLVDTTDITLTRLTMRNRAAGSSAPVLWARKRVERLRVVDCTIQRFNDTTLGHVIHVHHQSGISPADVTIVGSTLRQYQSGGVAVATESLGSLVIQGSRIEYSGTTTMAGMVQCNGVASACGSAVVIDTTWAGVTNLVKPYTGLTDGFAAAIVRSFLSP